MFKYIKYKGERIVLALQNLLGANTDGVMSSPHRKGFLVCGTMSSVSENSVILFIKVLFMSWLRQQQNITFSCAQNLELVCLNIKIHILPF